jgi:hypothetical protein
MEKQKLTITRNNFDEIKEGMWNKFRTVEEFVRVNGESVNVQFCLPEDYLSVVEPQRKKK